MNFPLNRLNSKFTLKIFKRRSFNRFNTSQLIDLFSLSIENQISLHNSFKLYNRNERHIDISINEKEKKNHPFNEISFVLDENENIEIVSNRKYFQLVNNIRKHFDLSPMHLDIFPKMIDNVYSQKIFPTMLRFCSKFHMNMMWKEIFFYFEAAILIGDLSDKFSMIWSNSE